MILLRLQGGGRTRFLLRKGTSCLVGSEKGCDILTDIPGGKVLLDRSRPLLSQSGTEIGLIFISRWLWAGGVSGVAVLAGMTLLAGPRGSGTGPIPVDSIPARASQDSRWSRLPGGNRPLPSAALETQGGTLAFLREEELRIRALARSGKALEARKGWDNVRKGLPPGWKPGEEWLERVGKRLADP